MSEIVTIESSRVALRSPARALPEPVKALPEPRVNINVHAGTMADVPFIDGLMKKHSKQLAFLPTNALEGKVRLGHVLIAEAVDSGKELIVDSGEEAQTYSPSTINYSAINSRTPVGYLIGNDRYKSRDELGVIYQLCVVPEYRRMLVGAHLLKARFETSAYGCKLYCCWCAQDLTSSNEFYESMGFVPIAFRAGSEKRSRVHIFWQKRIRAGDTTTPWWFPSETRGGLMDAARIALPIPPGMSWRDEMPRIDVGCVSDAPRAIGGNGASETHPTTRRVEKKAIDPPKPVTRNGLAFAIPLPGEVLPSTTPAKEKKPRKATPAKVKKLSPELAAKARELRDRWSECQDEFVALPAGKYDVGRAVATTAGPIEVPRMIAA